MRAREANKRIGPNESDTETSHKSKGQVQSFKMKICLTTLIVTSLLMLIIIQTDNLGETKKIKLKDLKKAKKYVYLLAAQRKKLYAIPFPVPLPVIVKRQHIYTQVPVVPRYVQQPYYSGTETATHESYSSPGDSYVASEPKQSRHVAPKKQTTAAGSTQATGASTSETTSYSSSGPTKYLTQLASALSQVYPSIGGNSASGSQRNVVVKLLSGQAAGALSSDRIKVGTLFSGLRQRQRQRPDYEADLAEFANSTIKESDLLNSASASEVNQLRASMKQHQQRPRSHNNNAIHRPLQPAFVPYRSSLSQLGTREQYQHHQGQQVYHPVVPHPMQLLAQQQLLHQNSELVQEASSLGFATPETLVYPLDMQAASSGPDLEVLGFGQPDARRVLEAIQRVRHHQALELLAREKEAQLAESSSLALAAHQLGIYPEQQVRMMNF